MRITLAVTRGTGTERVVGGVATEYYRASSCVLATYLYVEHEFRDRGLARRLLVEGRAACAALGAVQALLAESEWPDHLPRADFDNDEVNKARQRLGFFANIGARRLDIDYVQPALGLHQKPVDYLCLLALPARADLERVDDDELGKVVAAFLGEFYAALAQDSGSAAAGGPGQTMSSDDASALARMAAQCGASRPLTSLLPRVRQNDASLCFHFVQQLDIPGTDSAVNRASNTELLDALKAYTCPVLHSMETDLLSRAYRGEQRPMRTVCLTKPPPDDPDRDAGHLVAITFPEFVEFKSEARIERRYFPLRQRVVLAYLSLTAFFQARILIWHLTLRVDHERARKDARYWLDELDLITLQKLADDTANQEHLFAPAPDNDKRHIKQAVEFELPAIAAPILAAGLDGRSIPTKPLDLDELLLALGSVVRGEVARSARAQFPHDPERAAREVPPLPNSYEAVAVTLQMFGRAPNRFRNHLEREALCGIISCILDFDEIDEAEIGDTLAPSVKLRDALLRVHRVALVYVAADDRAARTVETSTGISPYLIIPQATVLCNEWLLNHVETRKHAPVADGNTNVLSARLALLENTLRERWVPNVFFYKTERDLFKAAHDVGGVGARRSKAEELLLKVKTDLQLARDFQRARFEAIVAGLLGAISVLSLDSLISKLVAKLHPPLPTPPGQAPSNDSDLWGLAVSFGLACVVGLVVYWWKRPHPDRDDA